MLNLDFKVQLTSRDWVNVRVGIQIAEENDWEDNERKDKHGKSKADGYLLPEGLLFAKLMLHVVFVHAFGYVHVSLNLGQLYPLEDIKRRLCEGPVNYRTQLEDKRDSQVGPVDRRSIHVELVDKETTFTDLWQADFYLIGAEAEVNALEDVVELNVSIVAESIALVFRVIRVVKNLVVFDLWRQLTLLHCLR